jgi:hypothetical protein
MGRGGREGMGIEGREDMGGSIKGRYYGEMI